MPEPSVGDSYSVERTFSNDAVRTFSDVTGDDQARHTEPDDRGRLLVQGLLTGAVLTDIGSDLEVLARSIEFRFIRPVYTGDAVRCTWTNREVSERERGWDVVADVTIERIDSAHDDVGDDPEVVLEATVDGLIEK